MKYDMLPRKKVVVKKTSTKPRKRSVTVALDANEPVSDGSLYLELFYTRPAWVHRRVETISFLTDDSTNRRVSYDFTMPSWAYPISEGDRIGVPITNMRKELLKSLSVTDASNQALSVWDTNQNGQIGTQIIQSLVSGYINRDLSEKEIEMVRTIVFRKFKDDVSWEVATLCALMREEGSSNKDALYAAESIIEEFVENFIFIVEVPLDYLDVRHVIKLSYDKEISRAIIPKHQPVSVNKFWKTKWLGVKKFSVSMWEYSTPTREFAVESSYFPSSASEHLEIHAPDDLQVTSLTRHIIDEDGERSEANSSSNTLGHIAHIQFKNKIFEGLDSTSIVEFAPVTSGLLVQAYLSTLLGWVLLVSELSGFSKLFAIVTRAGDAGPFAAITLALPAFLLTLLARSREHSHVKKTLRIPRAVALASTVNLFIAAITLVLEPSWGHLELILRVLVISQTLVFVIMSVALYTVLEVDRHK